MLCHISFVSVRLQSQMCYKTLLHQSWGEGEANAQTCACLLRHHGNKNTNELCWLRLGLHPNSWHSHNWRYALHALHTVGSARCWLWPSLLYTYIFWFIKCHINTNYSVSHTEYQDICQNFKYRKNQCQILFWAL